MLRWGGDVSVENERLGVDTCEQRGDTIGDGDFLRPDRGEPGDHESPARWPSREVFGLSEDEVGRVAMLLANWQRDDCRKDEDEVHDHEHGLQLAHDPGQCRRDESVAAHGGEEDDVDDAVARRPVAVSGDDDDG